MSQLQSFTVSKGDFSEMCDCRAAGGWPVLSCAHLLPQLKDGRSPKPALAVLWSPATAQHVPCGRAHANRGAISAGRRRGSAVQGTWLRSWAWLGEQALQPALGRGRAWGCRHPPGPGDEHGAKSPSCHLLGCGLLLSMAARNWGGSSRPKRMMSSDAFQGEVKEQERGCLAPAPAPQGKEEEDVGHQLGRNPSETPCLLTPSSPLLLSMIWTLLPLFVFPPTSSHWNESAHAYHPAQWKCSGSFGDYFSQQMQSCKLFIRVCLSKRIMPYSGQPTLSCCYSHVFHIAFQVSSESCKCFFVFSVMLITS